MADPNDDEWLYGAEGEGENIGNDETSADGVDEIQAKNGTNEFEFEEAGDDEHLIADDTKDHNESNQDASSDDDDDDDDDDDINVVIGDIKSGGPSARFGADQKQKQPGSKFNIEEFESVGTINGQPSIEFAIESIEDKPWRKPGADITDYFNYGFNEETWRAYCERQKRMRIHESGIGLASLTAAQNPQGMQQILSTGSSNEGVQRQIHIGFKRGPRLPKPPAVIDVIGSASLNPNRPPAPRENIIQVMTADRREYSRTVQPPMQMQPFNIPPEEFYNHEEQDFGNYGYEPTQDSQWDPTHPQPWAPGEIKQLTPLNQPPPNIQPLRPLNVPPPHHAMIGAPQMIPPLMGPQQQHMPMHIKQEMDDKRDARRMVGRDMRDDGRRHDDRKRMRERSTSREKDPRKSERRDERSRSERERYARESSSRRRSKSREKKRSRSREKSRRSRSKGDDKDRTRRDDKSSSSKRPSSSVVVKKEEL